MAIIPPQRHLFDVPEAIAYFNCAYYAPLLNASRDRLLAGVHSKCHPWERKPSDFFEDAETVRRLCARLLGGDADGFAVIPSASYGLSTAARALEPRLGPGDQILVIAEEFPSQVLPWRRTAGASGATLRTVPTPVDGDWTRAILDHLDRRTRVVATSTCHWTNGARIDLGPIGAACRDLGCSLVVDATQTLGAMPFSLPDLRPDFLVAAGYKWLLSPYGFTVLHVAEAWREARPLEESWQGRMDAEDFAGLVNYSDTYMPGARRFDMGEKGIPTLLPGAIAALEQLLAWGVANLAESLGALNARIARHLEELGFRLPDPALRCPHLLGATLPAHLTLNAVAELRSRDIFISQRGRALRFAPHLHIHEGDLARLFEGLDQLVRRGT